MTECRTLHCDFKSKVRNSTKSLFDILVQLIELDSATLLEVHVDLTGLFKVLFELLSISLFTELKQC